MQCKNVAIQLEKLNIIRRIIRHKLTMDFPLYPGQLHILEFVKTHKGCTQAEVAEHLMITPASVALSTKRMEKTGLLEKQLDPNNLRCKRLYITDEGERLSLHCRKTFNEIDAVMMKDFSEDELEKLNQYIHRFLQNLSEHYSCDAEEIDFLSLLAMNNMIKSKKKKGR